MKKSKRASEEKKERNDTNLSIRQNNKFKRKNTDKLFTIIFRKTVIIIIKINIFESFAKKKKKQQIFISSHK